MGNVVTFNPGQLASTFRGQPIQNDLGAGVQASFGIIGCKGKVWSIRYRGDTTNIMRPDGDGPANSIEVVILKAATNLSKVWYEHGYTEGSAEAPDCYAPDGIRPPLNVKKRQADACAICPRNEWGSRITPQGKQGKDCQDSKRLVVVPQTDLENEVFGGPMLLRVPAGSLNDLAQYGAKMQKLGFPYYSVATRISFDPTAAYPKFRFDGIRPLTPEEADVVLAHRDNPAVDRILGASEHVAEVPQDRQAELAGAFEQPPEQAPAKPAKGNGFAGVAQPQEAKKAPQQAPQAATEPKFSPEFEQSISAKLDALLPK